MSADEWRDRADHGFTVAEPTWEQVREAILALDGKRTTMVNLSDRPDSDQYMIIAGQWDGRFPVNATSNNADFFSLVDPTRSANKLTLYVGGQDGEYEERKCVLLARALEASEAFFKTGALRSSMNWHSDY